MRVHSKDSFKVVVEKGHEENIKDVAVELMRQIREQNCKFTIDTSGLLSDFLDQCGVRKEHFDSVKVEETCVYTHIDLPSGYEYYQTRCCNWRQVDHLVSEWKFCPYCGKKVKIEE